MALGNSNNVIAGVPDVSGGLWVGEVITDPTAYPDGTIDLAEVGSLIPVGYVGEEGVTETNERATDKKRAWGGDVVRVLQTEHTQTFGFTLIESGNPDVLKLVYGEDNVTVEEETGNVLITQNSQVLGHRSFVFEMLDGDTRIRKFIPDGQIIETGEITWVHSDIAMHTLTIEAFADSDGVKVYTYYVNDADGSVNSGDPRVDGGEEGN